MNRLKCKGLNKVQLQKWQSDCCTSAINNYQQLLKGSPSTRTSGARCLYHANDKKTFKLQLDKIDQRERERDWKDEEGCGKKCLKMPSSVCPSASSTHPPTSTSASESAFCSFVRDLCKHALLFSARRQPLRQI